MSTIQSGDPYRTEALAKSAIPARLRQSGALASGQAGAAASLIAGFGPQSGLVDPFADVFAAMAVAAPIDTAESSEPLAPSDSPSDRRDDSDVDADMDSESETKSASIDVQVVDAKPLESGEIKKSESQPSVTSPIVDAERGDGQAPEKHDGQSEIQLSGESAEPVEAAPIETDGVVKAESSASLVQQTADARPRSDPASSSGTVPPTDPKISKASPATTGKPELNASQESSDQRVEEFGFTSQSQDAGPDHRDRDGRRHRQSQLPTDAPEETKDSPHASQGKSQSLGATAQVMSASPAAETINPSAGENSPPQSAATAAKNVHQPISSVTTPASPILTSSANSSARPADSGGVVPIDQRGTAARTAGDAKKQSGPSDPARMNDLVARAKLVQRVSKAFQHFGNESGNIRLKLAPAELGSVRVEMQVRDKQVQARVVADSEMTAEILRQQLPELRSRLESQGMQVDRLAVEHDAGQEESGRFTDPGSSKDSGQGDPSGQWHERGRSQRPASDAPSTADVSQPVAEGVTATAATAGIDFRH